MTARGKSPVVLNRKGRYTAGSPEEQIKIAATGSQIQIHGLALDSQKTCFALGRP